MNLSGTNSEELVKLSQKKRITNVIAPEHVRRHEDHERKLEKQEKVLIESIVAHCSSFCNEFKGVAKGDWTESAITELEEISQSLKSIAE